MNDDITRIVDGLIERISAAGLIAANGFRGCLDSELDDLARYLNLPLPGAYRRVLRQCGHFEGYTFPRPSGSTAPRGNAGGCHRLAEMTPAFTFAPSRSLRFADRSSANSTSRDRAPIATVLALVAIVAHQKKMIRRN